MSIQPRFQPGREGGALNRRVLQINRRLLERGSRVRVDPPEGPVRRESLSRQLVRVLQESRDRDAFELLYLLNAPLLERHCRGRLARGPAWIDPGDVVDEAFLRIFRRCDTFRDGPRSSFTAWAIVIAENVMCEMTRKAHRHRMESLDADPVDSNAPRDPVALAIESEILGRTEKTWGTFVALCAASLMRLPPRWRQALELREGRGLSYAEIARIMGVRRGNVAMLIRRGRQRVLEVVGRALSRYEVDP